MIGEEPLVLLPGLLCDARLFSALELGERRVLVPSLADDASIEAMAARVLDHAPPAFALCGYSLGSSVALEIMRQARERVTRFAILSGHARADDRRRRAQRRALIRKATRVQFRALCAGMLRRLVAARSANDVGAMEALVTMMDSLGPATFIRQSRALMRRADTRAVLGTIRCPVLVMSGALDPITPLALQTELAIATNAKHVICPRAAHVLPVESPADATYWLRKWLRW